jgi:Skp family chaperone for outer membrane proteins
MWPFAKVICSVSGSFSRWFKEEAMKNRVLIIALAIAVLSAFSSVPRANAEPLTIMAIVGVATVLAVSTVDIVANRYDDNKEQRAQHEDTEITHAKAETTEQAPSSGKIEIAAIQN